MKQLIASFACILILTSIGAKAPESPDIRFEAVDIYIDSEENKLAAYQVEVVVREGDVKIVGVEGGEHPAFKTPPYYDPAALEGGRIILAAFDVNGPVPAGRTRVARVHVRVEGDTAPQYGVHLAVAASPGAEKIPATAEAEHRTRDTTD
jgi:hypothetical protein